MAAIIERPVYFVKLRPVDIWEDDRLENGIMRFGYHATPHLSALTGDWAEVQQTWLRERKGDKGTATRGVD